MKIERNRTKERNDSPGDGKREIFTKQEYTKRIKKNIRKRSQEHEEDLNINTREKAKEKEK